MLTIAILYNRANHFGIEKDAIQLERYLKELSKKENELKIVHKDPREVPMVYDVVIHLEVPYYSWFPYARYTCVMVNPEWWISEAFDPYVSQIDLLLCKNENVKDTLKVVLNIPEDKLVVIPWCSDVIKTDKQDGRIKEFLYLLGGSPNKAKSATDVVELWKPEYPTLHIYTTIPDFMIKKDLPEDKNVDKLNVIIHRGNISASAKIALQKKYIGHVACSEAEGFGYSAAEAEEVGAYCILNECDAYNSTYINNKYVSFLPSIQTSDEKTHTSKFSINMTESPTILDNSIDNFMNMGPNDIIEMTTERKSDATERRKTFKNTLQGIFGKIIENVNKSYQLRPSFNIPPPLSIENCPKISIVTLIYNRKKFWDVALHNIMITDYPRDKLEWVVVDDSDDMDESISNKIMKIQDVLPGLNVIYVPFSDKRSIGAKRNAGVKRSTSDIILMMDDDDHYPETSFRRRVAWLVAPEEQGTQEILPKKRCSVCTTIALYDLRTGISAVNVPPYDLPLGKRCSEATLTFTKSFWDDRKFLKINMAEGDEFIRGRESEVVEMPPQQIIVSFSHGSNSSSRRIPGEEDVKPGCFWGFPREYLEFIHGIVGITVEDENKTVVNKTNTNLTNTIVNKKH